MSANARRFLDTNVLIYAFAEGDPKADTALTVLGGGGMISVQVLNELAAVAHRKLKMSWREITDALDAIRVLCPSPMPVTEDMHDAASRLAAQHGFHIYNALIVAAALEANCTILYSEDLQSGQVIEGRLTIQNPFLP